MQWLANSWFQLLQTVSIVAGLCFTAFEVRANTKVRRQSNLIQMTQHHRDVWSILIKERSLARILDPQANTNTKPISIFETTFVNLVIMHVHSSFRAQMLDPLLDQKRFEQDIGDFFSLPIPQKVWRKARHFWPEEFQRFMEESRIRDKGIREKPKNSVSFTR